MTNEKTAAILNSNRRGLSPRGNTSPIAALAQTEGSAGAQYKIKKFIDDIYQKEMKYRYHKQYVREDYLHVKSPIFDLKSYHKLRPREDIIGIPEENEDDKNPMAASQSLTQMLAFQAGGPNVKNPYLTAQLEKIHNEIIRDQGESGMTEVR